MNKLKYKDTTILSVINLIKSGMSPDLICQMNSISMGTYYQWKLKYRGCTMEDIKRIHDLEEENAKLKKQYLDYYNQCELLRKAIEGKL